MVYRLAHIMTAMYCFAGLQCTALYCCCNELCIALASRLVSPPPRALGGGGGAGGAPSRGGRPGRKKIIRAPPCESNTKVPKFDGNNS